jgi:hypothetical protein
MPRMNEKQILPSTSIEPVADDWINKLNGLVGNVKGAIGEIKTVVEMARPRAAGAAAPGPESGPGLREFVYLLKKAGYGDKPIGQLITLIAPYTINQVEKIGNKLLKGGPQNGT